VIVEDTLREKSSQYLHLVEVAFYILVGVLLALAAAGGVFRAGVLLWGSKGGVSGDYGLQVLDQVLLVLMVIELLHTVRMSVRSQTLILEPFLIVGIMASIRRVLVITMQAAKMTEQGASQDPSGAAAGGTFVATMVELGLLGLLILILVFAIFLLRRASAKEELLG